MSIPRNAGASPYFYNHKFKSAGTPVARHFDSSYPFGHGLSYTQFEYSDLELGTERVNIDTGEIRLSVTLRNVGERLGFKVPQLYFYDTLASLVRPIKELKCFSRVQLKAGAAARVEFVVPVDMLNFTGSSGVRIVEPSEFELMVGASSGNIKLQTKVEVTGVVRTLECNWRMESYCVVTPL